MAVVLAARPGRRRWRAPAAAAARARRCRRGVGGEQAAQVGDAGLGRHLDRPVGQPVPVDAVVAQQRRHGQHEADEHGDGAAASRATGPRADHEEQDDARGRHRPAAAGAGRRGEASATLAPARLRHPGPQGDIERAVGRGGPAPVVLGEGMPRPARLAVEAGQGAQGGLVDREPAQHVDADLGRGARRRQRQTGLVQGGLEVGPRGDEPSAGVPADRATRRCDASPDTARARASRSRSGGVVDPGVRSSRPASHARTMTYRQNAAPATSTAMVAQPSTSATPSLVWFHGPGIRFRVEVGVEGREAVGRGLLLDDRVVVQPGDHPGRPGRRRPPRPRRGGSSHPGPPRTVAGPAQSRRSDGWTRPHPTRPVVAPGAFGGNDWGVMAYRLRAGDTGPVQQSPVTCGSACLTVARMLVDPLFASWVRTGQPHPPGSPGGATEAERFAAYERVVMRRTNSLFAGRPPPERAVAAAARHPAVGGAARARVRRGPDRHALHARRAAQR